MWTRLLHLVFYLYRPVLLAMITVSTAFFGSLALITLLFDRRGNRTYFVLGRLWARFNILISGVHVTLEGLENVDRKKPYIIMSNHQSHFDVLALIAYLPIQLRWVMKKELRHVPIFGIACARMGHIYIDRGNSGKARESLRVTAEKIRNGASVFFFPEGTRSPDGNLIPFKKGGFVMALAADVPILPITITGGRRILPKGSIKISPGKMKITIHKPVPVNSYTYETKEELIDRIRKIIAADLP